MQERVRTAGLDLIPGLRDATYELGLRADLGAPS